MNRAILMGRLGMDPELKHGQSGAAVLRLRLATDRKWLDKGGERQERTDWHTVVFFGKRAEGLSRHLSKGDMIGVEGRIETRQWDDKDGNKRYTTEVIGQDLTFGGGGQRSSGGGYGGKPASQPASQPAGGGDGFGDDDIPFGPVDERAH